MGVSTSMNLQKIIDIFGLQKDTIDLCPTCAMDFKDFMSAKRKKEIEYEKNLQSMRKNV